MGETVVRENTVNHNVGHNQHIIMVKGSFNCKLR